MYAFKKSINRWKWIKMAFKLSIFKKVQSKDDLICQPINIFPYSVFKYWIVNGILKCNCKIGSENGFLLFYYCVIFVSQVNIYSFHFMALYPVCLSTVESERRQMEAWPTAWWEMDWLSWQMKSTWRSAPPWNFLTAFPPVWPLTIQQPTAQPSTLKPPAAPLVSPLRIRASVPTSPLPPSHPSASRLTPRPLAPWPTQLSHSQPSHRKPSTTLSSRASFRVTTKSFPRMAGLWCLHPSLLLHH